MSTIVINQQTSEDVISVNVDGFCNHAGTHEEVEEFDDVNIYGPDHSYTETLEVCDRCGSYRLAYITEASEWRGVEQLPIIRGGQ